MNVKKAYLEIIILVEIISYKFIYILCYSIEILFTKDTLYKVAHLKTGHS